MTVALDSWGVLCFLQNEGPGVIRVEKALLEQSCNELDQSR